MCDYYVEMLCAGRFGLGWAHDAFNVACHMFMHFSCIRTIFLFLSFDTKLFSAFLHVSLSLSLSLFLSLVALWHLNANLLHPGTLFVLGHLFLLLPPLTSLHLMSSSMMIKPVRTFWRTSNDEAFIRNAKSFYRIFTVIYSRGWESLCGIPVTCPSVII